MESQPHSGDRGGWQGQCPLKAGINNELDRYAQLADPTEGDVNACLEPNDTSGQEAWDREVERRMEDLKAGRAVTVPWEELRRELLAKLDGH